MHSATKFLGGHSDISAGAVVAKDAQLVANTGASVSTGGTLDPEGFLPIDSRGLKTLEVRVERASKNAGELANFLQRHKKVSRVFYPGLPGGEGYKIAREQMSAYGMMLSLDVKGGGKAAESFINALKLWYWLTSLGGVESTVSYPVLSSHVNCSAKQLKELEISDATVRLSVGIESCDDLIAAPGAGAGESMNNLSIAKDARDAKY